MRKIGDFHFQLFIGLVYLLMNVPAQAVDNIHPFSRVEIAYAREGCQFQYSPFDFCDARHRKVIDEAVQKGGIDFNGHYKLIRFEEWRSPNFHSLAVVDALTGIVYPVPIDAYSGKVNDDGDAKDPGVLIYSKNGNKLCIKGSLSVYHAQENGNFCFVFDGKKFGGYKTGYMAPPKQ